MSAATATVPLHLLRLGDLDAGSLDEILELAARMKADPHGFLDAFRGETVACYFEKPSTRTRVSFAAAAHRLGMLPLGLSPAELQLGRGETIADTARTLSAYAAAIVMRTFRQEDVEEMARHASVPVVNALTDQHHPCQALADLLTLRERFGALEGLRLAFVGDGDDNVVHSLVEAAALTGMELVVCGPEERRPDDEVVARARTAGARVRFTPDLEDGLPGADAVYTDVWVSMGDEAETARRQALLAPYRVTPAVLARAKADAIFLHCLPAHRGEEVVDEVIDGPRSAVWQQAANREPTEQALLYTLLAARRSS
jgi:ornithine carbamoyltransferase